MRHLPRQLFIIPREVVESTSFEEVDSTYADMCRLNIAKAPFPEFDIETDAINFILDSDESKINWKVKFRFSETPAVMNWFIKPENGNWISVPKFSQEFKGILNSNCLEDEAPELFDNIYKLFLVLLATRGIIKEQKKNKAAALGIGKNAREGYAYTTTIRIGKIESDTKHTESNPPGTKRRPHLRRGHIRNQRFGNLLSMVHQIWISPTFINADENFISSRTAYKLTRKGLVQ